MDVCMYVCPPPRAANTHTSGSMPERALRKVCAILEAVHID
jgi:hypothetical protein